MLRLIAGQRRAALPFVLPIVGDGDPARRYWATFLMTELAYPEVVDSLVPRLFDPDRSVRKVARLASRAVGEVAPEALVERLVRYYRDPGLQLERRIEMIETLGELRERLAVPLLIDALGDEQEEVAAAARKALMVVTPTGPRSRRQAVAGVVGAERRAPPDRVVGRRAHARSAGDSARGRRRAEGAHEGVLRATTTTCRARSGRRRSSVPRLVGDRRAHAVPAALGPFQGLLSSAAMARPRVAVALVACALFAAPLFALADARAADEDPDVARLADGRSQKTTWVPPGDTERYGHADVLVHAPLAAVKKQVLDYGRYKELVPEKFHNAHVIGRQAGGTDVYMQLPIMRGLVTLWQVMRFTTCTRWRQGGRSSKGSS